METNTDKVTVPEYDHSNLKPLPPEMDYTKEYEAYKIIRSKAVRRHAKNKRAAQSRRRNRKPCYENTEKRNIRGEIFYIVKFHHNQRNNGRLW